MSNKNKNNKKMKIYNSDVEKITLEKSKNNIELLTDEDLKYKTIELKEKLKDNDFNLDVIKHEAFAVVREAAKRTIGMEHFDVQLLGGLAMLDGNISEMKTGEGKTLTVILPAYTMALKGEGVHIVTVNEYLAKRDAELMGKVFNFLGLTCGVNLKEYTIEEKKAAYNCDIMYSTSSELGFDYLRDNMSSNIENIVQRPLKHILIDEIDSVLIDEAKTPLIISGGKKQMTKVHKQIDAIVKAMKENIDYKVNLKDFTIYVREHGVQRIQNAFRVKNIYDIEYSHIVHAMNQSLRANYLLSKDVDYVVRDEKIEIIDKFTGRVLEGRTYNNGLHQAIEAKEGVKIQRETRTLGTITYQNFFRIYDTIAGMTGTAATEAEEFYNIYGLDVISIPTNKPMIRLDKPDLIFDNNNNKYKYMINYIKERHELGQPILIGTVSIETSEIISNLLTEQNINHNVLNAKNDALESHIIENAGKYKSVTIATNMAGRGTDIKIEDKCLELETYESKITGKLENPNGLLVIGTEKHDARRIDNQLRGRSGRQGDYGESIFFISFEDTLLKKLTSQKIKDRIIKYNDDKPFNNKIIENSIKSSQKQIESINYDMRENTLKYDDVLREQRDIIYDMRKSILFNEHDDMIIRFESLLHETLTENVEVFIKNEDFNGLEDFLVDNFLKISSKQKDKNPLYFIHNYNKNTDIKLFVEKIYDTIKHNLSFYRNNDEHNENEQIEVFNNYIKTVSLAVIDDEWASHMEQIDSLKLFIKLRGYGQMDPLVEYYNEAKNLFNVMIENIEMNLLKAVCFGNAHNVVIVEDVVIELNHNANNTNEIKLDYINDDKKQDEEVKI